MIEINVSEKTMQSLTELAAENGQSVSDFVGEYVEKEFSNGNSSNGTSKNGQKPIESAAEENKENPLMKFCGMFSSGKTDTSERMSELLREEDFDPAEGFSIR